MPHLQKAYATFKLDPHVKFILVSVDEDPKRLDRYVQEQQFEMPVARVSREQAAQLFNVNDTPTTFYIDATGTIRYEAKGMELHGDAQERVTWYINELKK